MAKSKYTFEDFVRDARAVHGDTYDYSQGVYLAKDKDIKIICPVHGPFMQRVRYHLEGHGCPHKDCKQKKREATNLERYGTANPMQVDAFREKHDETCIKKYGAATPFANQEVREKIISTMEERYGGRSAMCSKEVRAKSRAVSMDKYGVENPMQSDSVKSILKRSFVELYGVENPMQNADLLAKQQAALHDTMLERYGASNSFAVSELRMKAMATNLLRYGAENVMQSDITKRKNYDVRKENGTLNSSKPEDILYLSLSNVFGANNVERQYVDSKVYPWSCDFYIKSRNMFIELNASWTHGNHWFDTDNLNDNSKLSEWEVKKIEGHSFYGSAIDTWTVRDVEKRQAASNNSLNYVCFWDAELRDAAVWFAMECPDGHDYDGQYTWMPKREITGYTPKCSLTATPDSLSRWAKHYQFQEFYKRELAMWEANYDYRGLPLQMYLYHNRLKYTGKRPSELSDIEIMRGFKIAGILQGYSVFNISLMDQVVSKYNIKSVYDPCAGWGERELYCYKKGIAYQGNDINSGLADGYASMESELGMKDQSFGVTDSSVYQDSRRYDAVITCPPYGNTEIYSEYGAENLSDKVFLLWWQQVVRHTDSRYFCFQINQKYKEVMGRIVEDCGFKFLEELSGGSSRVSHFNRRQGGVILKKEYESMMVYERI